MSNPAESDRNGARGVLTLPAAEQRIAELEAQVLRLQDELAAVRKKHDFDKELLRAYILDDFPQTDEDLQRLVAEARPFRELMDKVDKEFGLGPDR